MEIKGKTFVFIFFMVVSVFFLACSPSTSSKVYVVARDPTWFPLQLMGKQDNVFAFSDDLLEAISSEDGFSVEMVNANWDNLLYNLWKRH